MLVKWRRKLADSSGVESYWILPNQTLYGLVEASRNDALLLSEVSGLGGEGKKRSSYGAAIIDILHKHHTQNPR
jgi:ribonuclease D